MKILFMVIMLIPSVWSQNLSPEDQKRLLEENKTLKMENQNLKQELSRLKPDSTDSARMMEVLQKGQRYQEEQLKALEELEKED